MLNTKKQSVIFSKEGWILNQHSQLINQVKNLNPSSQHDLRVNSAANFTMHHIPLEITFNPWQITLIVSHILLLSARHVSQQKQVCLPQCTEQNTNTARVRGQIPLGPLILTLPQWHLISLQQTAYVCTTCCTQVALQICWQRLI